MKFSAQGLKKILPAINGEDLYYCQSGRQDSNLRPPGPKPGAMTGLRYAPNFGCRVAKVRVRGQNKKSDVQILAAAF